jgi:hypothetical protein
MSEDEQQDREHVKSLPDESPTAGEASLRKGDIEVDEPKAGKGGHETHGAGEHDDPSN